MHLALCPTGVPIYLLKKFLYSKFTWVQKKLRFSYRNRLALDSKQQTRNKLEDHPQEEYDDPDFRIAARVLSNESGHGISLRAWQ